MKNLTTNKFSRRALIGGLAAVAIARPHLIQAGQDRPAQGVPAEGLAFDGGALILAAQGIWRSDDSGKTWTRVASPEGAPFSALASHPDRPGVVYGAMSRGGVMRSDDKGRTWQAARKGLPAVPVDALAIAAQEPDMLYVALRGDGLWRSRNRGETWEFAMDRPYVEGAELDVLSLASVRNATGMGGIWIYGGTGVGLTRVPDCFCRWQDVTSGDAMDALAAGREPISPKPLPAGEQVRSLSLAPDTPNIIFAGLPSGVWKSTDAGVIWSRITDGAVQSLAVNPADASHIVAANNGAIRVSRDGGETWTLFN